MVRPKELVEALLYSIQQQADLPSEASYVGYQPDIDSEPIKLPLVEVSMNAKVDVTEANTSFVEYAQNEAGERVGRVYEHLFEQDYEVSIWTAQDSIHSARDLGDTIRDVLFAHTLKGPAEPLVHPEVGELDEVWDFSLRGAEHTDDLNTSPILRRWQQTVTVAAGETYTIAADEPPIEAIQQQVTVDDSTTTIQI